jgi:hypothetical protein
MRGRVSRRLSASAAPPELGAIGETISPETARDPGGSSRRQVEGPEPAASILSRFERSRAPFLGWITPISDRQAVSIRFRSSGSSSAIFETGLPRSPFEARGGWLDESPVIDSSFERERRASDEKSLPRRSDQCKPDQSSARRIELLGFAGSYFTLAVWPAATRVRCSFPSRPVMSCAVS